MAVEYTQAGDSVAVFHEYVCPLSTLSSYINLGSVFTVADDDWAAVISKIRKVRKRWAKMLWILGQ